MLLDSSDIWKSGERMKTEYETAIEKIDKLTSKKPCEEYRIIVQKVDELIAKFDKKTQRFDCS